MSQLLYILKKELVNNALITVFSYFLNSNDNELYDASYAIYYKVKLIKKNFTKNKFIWIKRIFQITDQKEVNLIIYHEVTIK